MTGIQRHLLDETQLVAALERPREQLRGVDGHAGGDEALLDLAVAVAKYCGLQRA